MPEELTDAMIRAGNLMASSLYDASVCKCLGEHNYTNPPNLDIIERYLNEEIDSVTAIYLAMQRAAVTSGTCKDCKHWRRNHKYLLPSLCQFDDDTTIDSLMFHAADLADDYTETECGVVTGPDFSCVHLTPRKKKKG